ncbi:MAG: thiamine phosphate synthase [Thermodesulfovibrionales bacterium]|nr:thiamine phosphate synthase [Thermodesulfovibrionales bacterium]
MYLNGLCFITAGKGPCLTLKETAALVLSTGVKCIQYREKNKSRKDIYGEALMLRKLANEFNAVFIVNDYIDIALAVDADGVHLGQEDFPLKEARKILGSKKIIGISTHNIDEATAAEAGGADYIGFGPIFHTATKDAGKPKGVEALKEIKRHIKIPVVAIGGINIGNLRPVIDSGADAVAVSSGILKGNISENITRFFKALYRENQIV